MKKKKSFTVVSGIMRSGTSAMMRALMYCNILISGFKYPYLTVNDNGHPLDAGSYTPKSSKQRERNANGYWEIATIARGGLVASKGIDDLEAKVIKVIIPSLMASDVSLIHQVLLMVRDPRRNCTSMKTVWDDNTLPYLSETIADLYVMNHARALEWLRSFGVRYKIVIYEELLEHPEEVLKDLCAYLKQGDYKDGVQAINKDLNQSKPYEGDVDWTNAYRFYKAAKDRDIEVLNSFKHEDYSARIKVAYDKHTKEDNKKIVLPHEVTQAA